MKHPSTLPRQWRPREKLLRYGASSLSMQELWSCILGVGRPGKPVQKLASWIVSTIKDGFTSTPSSDRYCQELGKSQAARVLATLEVSQRWQQKQHLTIQRVEDVLLLTSEMAQSHQEQVFCLYLSSSNQLLHTEKIALGSLNAALLYPRDLFYPIRFHPVASLILCHNHPSGNATPSDEDKAFTKRVQEACELLGMTLFDHVIVSSRDHFSFREAGLLHAAK